MSCDWRRSLITHPDAISFLRILGERVFQQPLAIALTIPVLSAAIYDMSSRLPSMPAHCEIIEVRNSADELGFPCSRTASKECSDCGIQLCEDHAEPCGTCFSIFCPPCRFLHRAQHSKPAHGERRERKRGLESV